MQAIILVAFSFTVTKTISAGSKYGKKVYVHASPQMMLFTR